MNQEHNQEHALIPPKYQEMSRNCEKVYIFEYITIFIFIIFWDPNKVRDGSIISTGGVAISWGVGDYAQKFWGGVEDFARHSTPSKYKSA